MANVQIGPVGIPEKGLWITLGIVVVVGGVIAYVGYEKFKGFFEFSIDSIYRSLGLVKTTAEYTQAAKDQYLTPTAKALAAKPGALTYEQIQAMQVANQTQEQINETGYLTPFNPNVSNQ